MKRYMRLLSAVSLIMMIIFLIIKDPFYPVYAQSEICAAQFQSVALPLTELGDQEYIRMDGEATGFTGGLYPGGNNEIPTDHLLAALMQARSIQPLDRNGNLDLENGKIVMVSIGMSNTNDEFGKFSTLVHGDQEINEQLILVNGALANQTSDRWTDPAAIAWQVLADKLDSAQVSPLQVQTAWIKLTRTGGGDFPDKAQTLQADLEIIVRNLKAVYPNVKIAYFSSRIYSYTYEWGLSPEPHAYETGFSVKWLIKNQIDGDPDLNYDPLKGAVVAPLLLWGPYLWADGQNPRADGLTWLKEDLTQDCTHPTESGQLKVANLLMEFFKSDSTATGWFLEDNGIDEYDLFIPFIKNSIFEPDKINNLETPIVIKQNSYSERPITTMGEEKDSAETTFFALIMDWLKKLFKIR